MTKICAHMTYDDKLAQRVRKILSDDPSVGEKKMFGGLCFMRRGHMCCGIVEERLMLKLGEDHTATALEEPDTRPMDFTGRVSKTMIYVHGDGIAKAAALRKWVQRAVAFNDTQPVKVARSKKKASKKKKPSRS